MLVAISYAHRNDIDTIGLRNGCTFTGFTGSSFDGDQMVLTAGTTDRSDGDRAENINLTPTFSDGWF